MKHLIDLSALPFDPKGLTYEKTYGLWLDTFRHIAYIPPGNTIEVVAPPASWVPLLMWLGADVTHPRVHFKDCDPLALRCLDIASNGTGLVTSKFTRTQVEVLSSWRPETTDALYKCDMQWHTYRTARSEDAREFVVTTNGSFHRKEILDTMAAVDLYTPPSRKVVLSPCAADKPYPSTFQRALRDALPDGWYMAVTSTILGVVPDEIALHSPAYDGGLPYHWRLFTSAREYFQRNPHDCILALTDFNSIILREALRTIDCPVIDFILPVEPMQDYRSLMPYVKTVTDRIAFLDRDEVWQ